MKAVGDVVGDVAVGYPTSGDGVKPDSVSPVLMMTAKSPGVTGEGFKQAGDDRAVIFVEVLSGMVDEILRHDEQVVTAVYRDT